MTNVKKEYGVVGLGRMGGNLARQALERRSSNGKLTTLEKEWLAQGK